MKGKPVKRFLGMAAAAGLLAVPQPALAADYCDGTLSGVFVDHTGAVIIDGSWRGDWTMICNIKQEWNGLSPDVCVSWLAMVNAAVSMGRILRIYYSGSSETCATLATYGAAPGPYYVMLK